MLPDRVSNPGPLTYKSGTDCAMRPGIKCSKPAIQINSSKTNGHTFRINTSSIFCLPC